MYFINTKFPELHHQFQGVRLMCGPNTRAEFFFARFARAILQTTPLSSALDPPDTPISGKDSNILSQGGSGRGKKSQGKKRKRDGISEGSGRDGGGGSGTSTKGNGSMNENLSALEDVSEDKIKDTFTRRLPWLREFFDIFFLYRRF